jgi:hypothetical protein
MQHHICKNCEHTFQGNFCNNCGQKSSIKRLQIKNIWEELKYTVLHFNSGLSYSIKQLFTRPGHTIREYLEGKRVNHYKPFLMVFVLAGFTAFLLHFVDFERIMQSTSEMNSKIYGSKYNVEYMGHINKFSEFVMSKYPFIELSFIPIISLANWLAFKNRGYNYAEHLYMAAFTSSQRLLLHILFVPMYLVKNIDVFSTLMTISFFVTYGFTAFTYTQLFNNYSVKSTLLKLLLSAIWFFFIYLTIIVLGVIITSLYLLITKH